MVQSKEAASVSGISHPIPPEARHLRLVVHTPRGVAVLGLLQQDTKKISLSRP